MTRQQSSLTSTRPAHFFKLLDDFQKLSGLRVNPTKTEGMWIGSSRQNKTKPLGIKWPEQTNQSAWRILLLRSKIASQKKFS